MQLMTNGYGFYLQKSKSYGLDRPDLTSKKTGSESDFLENHDQDSTVLMSNGYGSYRKEKLNPYPT